MYLPDTNVLVTRFFADEGMAEVIDFMPVGREAGGADRQASRQVIRIAKSIRGADPVPHGMPAGVRLRAPAA